MKVKLRAALILVAVVSFGQSPDAPVPPNAAEQGRIVVALRKSAMRYQGQLPDFVCTKVTTRSVDPTGTGDHLKQRDVLEEHVAFSGGRAVYTLLKVDNKPTKKRHDKIGGMSEDGLLAMALVPAYLFGPRAPVSFEWKRWDTIDGKPAHVIEYQVQPSVTNYPDGRTPFLLGFYGLAWVGASDNSLMRLEEHDDGPVGYPIQGGGNTMDFATVNISGTPFLLPVRGATFGRIGKASWRNDMVFTNYGKFQAETTIKFENSEVANPPK
jgi:hypothetical protein